MIFEFSDISLWAVLVAALLPFAVGFLWYGPLAGKAWQKEIGLSDKDLKNANMPMTFGLTFLANLVLVYVLAGLLNYNASELTASEGAKAGLLIGVAFQAMMLATQYLFAQKSLRLWLIDAGYTVLNTTIAGAILGAMLV